MKKIISIFLCISFIISCAACISGCSGEDFAMFSGKKANFILVRPQTASKNVVASTNYFRKAILDTHEISVTYKQDNVKVKAGQVEVNVGVTNRPNSKKLYDELVKANENYGMDYTISFEDDIIYIVAGSDIALQNAVDFFLSHFCGYTTSTIKRNFSYKYHFDATFSIGGNKNISNYKIVTPRYNMSYLIGKQVDDLQEALLKATGSFVKRVDDSTKKSDYEIIICETKRDGEPLPFNTDEYVIRADDKKIYINGGSDLATSMGVKKLVEMVNNGETIDSKLDYVGSASYDQKQSKDKNYMKLTWSDEFDKLDTKVWNIANGEYSHNSSWLLDKKIAFSKNETNVNVKDGKLNLKATETQEAYLGVEMRTDRSVWYKYGLIEMSGKFNCSAGITAAFWALGFSSQEVHGEFDIFECLGKQDQIKATPLSWVSGSALEKFKSGAIYSGESETNSYYTLPKGDSFDDEYHTIGLDWDEKSIRWVYDGKVFLEIDTTTSEQAIKTFNGAMQVILTLYAGPNVASQTGIPDETTDWENNGFNVDYVRLYQLPEHTLTLK